MTTISERLRYLKSLNEPGNGGPYGGFAAEQCMVAMGDAADTIDALVAALEETLKVAERNERGDFGDRARAALALARK